MTEHEKRGLEQMKRDPDKYLAKLKNSLPLARSILGDKCVEDNGAMSYIHHCIAALEAEKERRLKDDSDSNIPVQG
jgi:hypothetical protein